MLADILLVAVTITSVVGGSVAEVEAKTTKCKTGIYVAGKFYNYKFEDGDRPFKIHLSKTVPSLLEARSTV